ncbi:ABC transporter substrate-binding protein [Salinirubellus sp. GCM10025818]|uniref:ABC transporter substrate-binding protein n=1 Tax=Salinirubellus TaxID=2162630 RepID=UPI0030D1DD5D
MRVVSTSPSGTEILCALGVDPVAVSHACDYPPRVRDLPVLDRSPVDATASADRHAQVERAAGAGHVYEVDTDLLRSLEPDLVLTQEVCGVCAVDAALVDEVLADADVDPDVVGMSARSLSDVYDCVRRVGRAVGREGRAGEVIDGMRSRIGSVERRAPEEGPRMAVLEWLDPVRGAGNWVPELVAAAGGTDVLGEAGERSVEVPWNELRAAAPEVLVLAPCGFDEAETVARLKELADRPGWEELPAVEDGRVFALDGASYLTRWTPRLAAATERLGALAHPATFGPPEATRLVD